MNTSDPTRFFLGKYKAELVKRKDVKDASWSVRVYLADERKYWVCATGEADLDAARAKAMTLVMEMGTAKSTGHTSVSPTLDKLVEEYTAHLSTEKMSSHTRVNINRRLAMCVQFMVHKKHGKNVQAIFTQAMGHGSGPSASLRLKDVAGTDFMDYLTWRLSANASLRRDTVNMELVTIRQMFRWARQKKLCGENSIPVWEFKLEDKKATRARIDENDANKTLAMAKEWSDQPTRQAREVYTRKLMYYVLAVMAATGMRTGEVLGLRNKHIKVLKPNLCEVNLEHGKMGNKAPRVIPVNGTPCMLLEWIATHQIHKDADSYVFPRQKAGDQFAEGAFNKIHQKFTEEMLKPQGLKHITPYHQRHNFITESLRAGANIIDVAAYTGTSARMISQTYSHVTGRDAGVRLLDKLGSYRA